MVTPSTLPDWLRKLYPFTPQRHPTSAGEISYLDEGHGDEAVLMVHGNPTWSFFYRDLVLRLRSQVRCVVPDHLGCGLSDKPQHWSYTLPDHIANLRSLIDKLALRKIHLVVHDWGGPIGLGALLPRPEQLGRVVILNTAAFADTVVPWRIRFCRAPLLGELAVRGLNGFAGPATWMSVTRPLAPDVKRGFLFPYRDWASRIATHRFVVDIPSGHGTRADVALREIETRLPLLRERAVKIVWGGKDFCFNEHYYRRWRTLLPGAEASFLAEAGHYVLEDGGTPALDTITSHLLAR